MICSDLSSVRLSRAAATSSAVPVVFSPVTFNNYGGHCDYAPPPSADAASSATQPVGRLAQRQRELRSFENSADRPFLHLVDGGISDNLGLRTILERFQEAEFSEAFRRKLHIERLRRTLLIVVNSRSDPSTEWDRSEGGPMGPGFRRDDHYLLSESGWRTEPGGAQPCGSALQHQGIHAQGGMPDKSRNAASVRLTLKKWPLS